AGMSEHGRAILVGVLVHDDPVSLRSISLASFALGSPSGIVPSTVPGGRKAYSMASVTVPRRCRRTEHGNAVRAAHRGLPIERERSGPWLRCRPRDRRMAVAPVVAASGEQPHRVTGAAHDQPVAVVLDLVDPLRSGRRLGGASRDARLNEAIKP